jgi:2,3-dihydroxybenzoate decarboxylase
MTTSGNFSNPALLCCIMEMGIDRILFAVDCRRLDGRRAPIWDEDKTKILSGNSKRLLRM